MIVATIPDDEESRLIELMDYLILDTPGEGFFDLVTQLAAGICEVPTSLVTFIASDRQWIKSVHAEDKSIWGDDKPRDVAFCSHTILSDELMEVKDALYDPRFSDNPLVAGNPHIRFYAGAPITTSNGYHLGALCVISDKPKVLSQHQKDQLVALANMTIKMLEVRKAMTHNAEEKWRIEESNKIKELLLAHMSHELITPLNAIVGYAQILESDLEEAEHVEYLESVSQILERSDYLLRMITNILEFSGTQLESLEFHFENANVKNEIDQALDALQKMMELKKIHLTILIAPELITARIDRYWFRHVITCYVSNAVEIAPIEGKIMLRLSARSAKELYLEVENCNSGINIKDTAMLFSHDQQMHSSLVKKYPGIGLNLMLVKQVIEAQGGIVGALNVDDSSCIFHALFCSDNA